MEMSAKLCVLMVLLIFSDCARKAGVKGDVTPTVFSSAGGHITLHCNNVLDEDCFSTTWIYNSAGHDGTTEEVGHGQVKQDSPTNRSKRLMVESDCSLNITDVTTEDAGLYTCQQFPKEDSKSTSAFPTILASTSTSETITDSTTTPSLILKDHTVSLIVGALVASLLSAIIVIVVICKKRANSERRTQNNVDDNISEMRVNESEQPPANDQNTEHYASIKHLNQAHTKHARKSPVDTVIYSTLRDAVEAKHT
ncbi:uncharacterized protein LOC121712031 isoform X6 [Alosa sapidissima]|uniref:uncharacterized protein LOC121712031 isoform X6 n=1 Tax=Alosa sapidissima TaxID=34773 RepID=UPI001C082528|nr:uncharacterized protein LOC121712031 isoform X6 [Alosa sapidissima]